MADESLPAVAGGSAAAGESVPAAAPKSSFLSFLKSGDVMRQVIIILTLAICLAVVVYLMVWAKGSAQDLAEVLACLSCSCWDATCASPADVRSLEAH